jgi:hypothetical protein
MPTKTDAPNTFAQRAPVAKTERIFGFCVLTEDGQISAPNEISQRHSVFATDARSRLRGGGEDDRCVEQRFLTRLGRCNRRELGDRIRKIAMASFAPVRIGANVCLHTIPIELVPRVFRRLYDSARGHLIDKLQVSRAILNRYLTATTSVV